MGARRHVGALLDLNPATLRNWIEDEERREGTRAPIATVRGADSDEVLGRADRRRGRVCGTRWRDAAVRVERRGRDREVHGFGVCLR